MPSPTVNRKPRVPSTSNFHGRTCPHTPGIDMDATRAINLDEQNAIAIDTPVAHLLIHALDTEDEGNPPSLALTVPLFLKTVQTVWRGTSGRNG